MPIPNTFGLPATADQYIEAHSVDELRDLLDRDRQHISHHCLVVGAGSNMVFTRHYPGTVIHMANKGIQLLHCDEEHVLCQAAAGEVWDDFVHHCIAQGWYGAENLVAIPGTVGAAPVQNVGAYGIEAKDIIHSVHTVEIGTGNERIFSNEECRFGYRDSIFKHELAGRYIVCSVVFRLNTRFAPNLSYKALANLSSSANLTAKALTDAITELRWSKLPRPEETGSAGSFFKNPVVPASQYEALRAQYPDIVAYPVAAPAGEEPSATSWKLAAGWLIEHAGWKGRSLGRAGVYEKQALVLVNRGGCTGEEVQTLADTIVADIQNKFGVTLTPEAIIV